MSSLNSKRFKTLVEQGKIHAVAEIPAKLIPFGQKFSARRFEKFAVCITP